MPVSVSKGAEVIDKNDIPIPGGYMALADYAKKHKLDIVQLGIAAEEGVIDAKVHLLRSRDYTTNIYDNYAFIVPTNMPVPEWCWKFKAAKNTGDDEGCSSNFEWAKRPTRLWWTEQMLAEDLGELKGFVRAAMLMQGIKAAKDIETEDQYDAFVEYCLNNSTEIKSVERALRRKFGNRSKTIRREYARASRIQPDLMAACEKMKEVRQ